MKMISLLGKVFHDKEKNEYLHIVEYLSTDDYADFVVEHYSDKKCKKFTQHSLINEDEMAQKELVFASFVPSETTRELVVATQNKNEKAYEKLEKRYQWILNDRIATRYPNQPYVTSDELLSRAMENFKENVLAFDATSKEHWYGFEFYARFTADKQIKASL